MNSEYFETKSGSDGTFKFNGVFPSSEYVIEPLSDDWKTMDKVTAQSGPEGQTAMLGKPFVVRFTQNKVGVVVDSKTGLQWAPSNGQKMTHFQSEGYVRSIALDGGWRMPSVAELKQIHPGHLLLHITSENWVWSGKLCNSDADDFTPFINGGECYYRRGHPTYMGVCWRYGLQNDKIETWKSR